MEFYNTVDDIPDTEDKKLWQNIGQQYEQFFIEECRIKGIDIQRNPKKSVDPTLPDLIYKGEHPAELKTQTVPFFTARKYGFIPEYTVTFNRKDYENYTLSNKNIFIFFRVCWNVTSYNGIKVSAVNGCYWLPFSSIKREIEAGHSPEHVYKRRIHDNINAKSSFLLDIHWMNVLFNHINRNNINLMFG